jgi:hypothetical protein
MSGERPALLEHLLADRDQPLIDEAALARLVAQIGLLHGADAVPVWRDLARALNRTRITLDPQLPQARFNSAAHEVCQRTFWLLIHAAIQHQDGQVAAICRDIIARSLTVQRVPNVDVCVEFDRDARGTQGVLALEQLHARIIEAPSVPPQDRLRTAIHHFPLCAHLLPALLRDCPHPKAFAADLIQLIWTRPDHPALSREILEAAWQAIPDTTTRIALLRQMTPQARAIAGALAWGALFVAHARDDQERAALLDLHSALHDVVWSDVAASLLASKEPYVRQRALQLLSVSATRDCLPALAAARPAASRAERRLIDNIIAGIHQREPLPGDASGSLSLAQNHGGQLSLSLAHTGDLSIAEPRALAPLPAHPPSKRLIRTLAALMLLAAILTSLLAILAALIG